MKRTGEYCSLKGNRCRPRMLEGLVGKWNGGGVCRVGGGGGALKLGLEENSADLNKNQKLGLTRIR